MRLDISYNIWCISFELQEIMNKKLIFMSLAMVLYAFAGAQTYTEVNLNSYENATIVDGDYANGATQFTAGAGNIPFVMAGTATQEGANFNFGVSGATNPLTIAVGEAGITDVYTEINSAFGASGINIGSVEFVGASGNTYTQSLIEGTNVRDFNNYNYENSASNLYASTYWSGGSQTTASSAPHRLDVQQWILPTSFASDTLQSIIITRSAESIANGSGFNPGLGEGIPLVFGITTEQPAPEPKTIVIALGAVLVPLFMRRRK